MRVRAILFALVAFAAAGAGAWRIAGEATARFERDTAAELEAGLRAAGQGWAGVAVDGLVVTLSGSAPDETSRFKAAEIARAVVDERRIRDETTVAAVAPLPPPPFALELLRNDDDVSLIGLVPERDGRDAIRAALGSRGLGASVTDMLESADETPPEGWGPALDFGLTALAALPRAKISVGPGTVRVVAVADDDAGRLALESRLRRTAPAGVALSLEISAPRPVIAPFALDFALKDGTATLARCSADSEEAAAVILAAARAAGVAGDPPCPVGLGTPSPDWAAAMAKGIGAVRAMGGGRFVASDIAATLTGAPGMTPEALTQAVSALRAALPPVFQLTSVAAPQMAAGENGAAVYAPEFHATLGPDGRVSLSGPVGDAAAREAVGGYAAALFSQARVGNALVIDPDVPAGWSARLLAAVEALATLKEGRADVTGTEVRLSGWSLDRDVAHKASELLAAKVGAGAVVDVRFNAEAAEAVGRAARPRPELCAEQIDAILDSGSINFAKGSAEIAPESRGVIAAIADVLRGCAGADFEIGGHTDSQGSPEGNRRLSEARAEAVLAALRAENLPLVGLVARGYGAEAPVGDNATDAGRAKNRRIEFTPVEPAPVAAPAARPELTTAPDDAGAAAVGACVATANGLVAETPVAFEPGSATLAPASGAVIDAVSAALHACPDAAIEVGGYTDSQGSEAGNLALSQSRAEAVLAALRRPDLPLPKMVAHGYGEADPVADNATEAGRAKNRRIAFVPVASPEPTPEDASARAAAQAGSGDEADPAPGPEAACVATGQAEIDKAGIVFAAGAAEIGAESRPVIAAVAAALAACPDAAVEVGGHTDSQGSEQGNQRLSQSRAEAVLAALRAAGAALPNATAKGYGEAQPIADNATEEGRARNRRIALTLGSARPAATGDGTGAAGAGNAGGGDADTGDADTGDDDGSE